MNPLDERNQDVYYEYKIKEAWKAAHRPQVKVINKNSLGFFTILTLIFITLKLLDKINWSWWWVLSPTLIPVGLGIILFIIGIIITFIFGRTK